ncbi:hypothetical protein SAMN05446635_5565 [Burkholderia sp. OK233]|nr:hypothetical protein SAMN05446635_5565 [Burkholderia sp. OK233]
MRECFVARVTDEVVASDAFASGRTAGRTDGERYVASGGSGIALREMLATDIPVARNTRFGVADSGEMATDLARVPQQSLQGRQ